MPTSAEAYQWAKNHPSAWLLLVQIFGIAIYPLFANSDTGRVLFGVFGVALLASAMWLVKNTPGTNWIGASLVIPSMVLSMWHAIEPSAAVLAWASGFEAAFYFFAAGSLIAYMLRDHDVSLDELFAVGATFTLIAWAFAHLYMLCQSLEPQSFLAAVDSAEPRTWTELLFLSFTTLSSTGLGDVIPVKSYARAVTTVEMFAGVMYVTLVVARLVTLVGAPRPT